MPMPYKEERNQELYEAWKAGESTRSLARRFGLGRNRVKALLRKHEDRIERRRRDLGGQASSAGWEGPAVWSVMYSDPTRNGKDGVIYYRMTEKAAREAVRKLNADLNRRYGRPEQGKPFPFYYAMGERSHKKARKGGDDED